MDVAHETRVLTHREAEAFYDRFGGKQDRQAFYEDRVLDDLARHVDFSRVRDLLEFGCGTGRLAERLLEGELPSDARYFGLDVSATMVDLARSRLARFGSRAQVSKTGGSIALDLPDASFDGVVSTYVLDLLAESDVTRFVEESRRVLRPRGVLAVAGLTHGERGVSRLVASLWAKVHALRPELVGGCRPLEVAAFLDREEWRLVHRRVVTAYGIPSEVLIAERREREERTGL